MLSEYLKNFTVIADSNIEGWRNIDKNKLCFLCCENEHNETLYNAYLSAIIVRYWGLIRSNVRQGNGAYDEWDCYNWLIDSILGTIKTKSWLNPESSLYNDSAAPDKSINVRMKSHRQGFYQWSNCKKRSLNFTSNYSYEQLYDLCGDKAFPSVEDLSVDSNLTSMYINKYIESEFKDKNYISSFLLHTILNYDVFDAVKDDNGKKEMQFNKKKLYSTLKHMDDDFANKFSTIYEFDSEEVNEARNQCVSLSRVRLYQLIDKSIEKISKKFQTFKNQ